MPPLLLDAHLARALVAALRQQGVDAVHVADWWDGQLRDAPDDRPLAAAAQDGRVLVTLDAATLPDTAWGWVGTGRSHAGVLVITSRINQADVGEQDRAVRAVLTRMADRPWQDLVVYGQRQQP